MKLEILHFDDTVIYWIRFSLPFFGFWVVTEKWWSSGNELVIGIRFGSKVWERRWGK